MRSLILAANWKMNGNKAMLKPYFDSFFKSIPGSSFASPGAQLVFSVPYLYLEPVRSFIHNASIKVAAQNCHWEEKGAFTGEISANMLKDCSVNTVLIGHSERRQYFGETEDVLAKKLKTCQLQDMEIIYCIGETLVEREKGQTKEVLRKQLSTLLTHFTNSQKLTVAYEPVWAIGTGLAATPGQAGEAHEFIREQLGGGYGVSNAQKISLLYGGSSNGQNVSVLIEQSEIDGFLVGGASLKAEEFAVMWNAITAAAFARSH